MNEKKLDEEETKVKRIMDMIHEQREAFQVTQAEQRRVREELLRRGRQGKPPPRVAGNFASRRLGRMSDDRSHQVLRPRAERVHEFPTTDPLAVEAFDTLDFPVDETCPSTKKMLEWMKPAVRKRPRWRGRRSYLFLSKRLTEGAPAALATK